MHKLEPVALTADDGNTYSVRFRTAFGEVVFPFKIEEEPFRALGWEPEFSGMVVGDPAAYVLNHAIAEFHEARNCTELQATQLIIENADTYRVCFTSRVEYIFAIQKFETVKFDGRFNILDLGDPIKVDPSLLEMINTAAVDHLKRAICYLHECIHFRYEVSEEPAQSA